MKVLASNKKAFFEYEILDKYEAGISLYGWEVKSIKSGNFSISGSYIVSRNHELFIVGMRASLIRDSFEQDKNKETRERRLLLKKSEIYSIISRVKQKGLTIVPLEMYLNNRGLIKVQIGTAKGKKKYQKKDKIKQNDQKRSLEIDRKSYNL